MQYRTFGKTGMKVSAVTLGTWGMGGVGWDVYDDDVKDSLAVGMNDHIAKPFNPEDLLKALHVHIKHQDSL